MNTSLRFLMLMISVLLLSSCYLKGQNESGNSPSDSLNVQIGRFLDEWHNAASRADMQAYFDKGKAWSFQAEERNIYPSGDQNIVWFDEKLRSASGPLRGSGVLIHKNGVWKIAHYVLSLPVPNDKFSEVLEIIGGE